LISISVETLIGFTLFRDHPPDSNAVGSKAPTVNSAP
jgi:hypothetical protein